MKEINSIYLAILDGDMAEVQINVTKCLQAGEAPETILNEGMIKAMREVGHLFEEGEYFVPEMLISARAMKAGLEIVKPLLVDSGIEPIGKIAIGTVKGDLHDIGKNLVAMMLEGRGFDIVDLGTDVEPERFVSAAQAGANLIGLSALLTTTMPMMEQTIQTIKTAGLRDHVKIMIGGAPVTEEYARQIGSDGFAPDASQAVTVALNLIHLSQEKPNDDGNQSM